MSHFTVMVIGNNPEVQLQPFDENKDVPKYLVGDVPKGEIDDFFKFYTTPSKHVTRPDALDNKLLNFDQLYEKKGEDWNGSRWERNKEGKIVEYSTYNPKSKWDWYVLGGRWPDRIELNGGQRANQAILRDIANFDEIETFAVLKDGKWYERGKMLWFGIVEDEKEEYTWSKEIAKLKEGLSEETLISIYDCHI